MRSLENIVGDGHRRDFGTSHIYIPKINIWPAITFQQYSRSITSNGVTVDEIDLSLETFVRVKGEDGKWYLTCCRREYRGTVRNYAEVNVAISAQMRLINHDALKLYQYSKVSLDLKDVHGNAIFTLDNDQRSEEERLGVGQFRSEEGDGDFKGRKE